ncbi:heavy metal translocating P-type ATPase [Dyadobacter sandarakinus]|uniref:Heavy metal translocating P-type ATPase metal-binding domain-containing protein n=1 Tax=Dyadobacter sandarakinus TaxID=2747268 RepID=A0ABX7I4A1_9BACT|nr:heavy metal translocating P-type ATPase metal-binding domain-containing protein [Dyadobacter sandarakinus]QRR00902.1 heavy metal translocating P-type ATPase metal-binding domain-containing protein [Dyadobacter sandarakinus]
MERPEQLTKYEKDAAASIRACHHCGEQCREDILLYDGHAFCCEGCRTVFDILQESNLCRYYELDGPKGLTPAETFPGKFDYLDLPEVASRVIEFTDGKLARVNWLLPKIHCISCIWLLENLNRLHPAVRSSEVNFPEKKVSIVFEMHQLTLSNLASLLTSIGYEPYLSLDDLDTKQKDPWQRTRLYKTGIAGFAFGNIMMLSFPEYFHLGTGGGDQQLRKLFTLLNFGLSIPVLLYCASDFFRSACSAWRGRYFNIDAPLALALSSVYAVSIYQLVTQSGPGYFDSFAGSVFFLLLGRYFQDKTYAGIAFDRDYKSYFPVAVTVVREDGTERRTPVSALQENDEILLRNRELVPADATLLSPAASIDYSFVSGESEKVERTAGDVIYAGGRHTGTAVRMKVLRKVSQSYLTQLWNNEAFAGNKEEQSATLAARINRYFSVAVFLLAVTAFGIWFFVFQKTETAFLAFATTLVVACPCGLFLSATFTYGNLLAILGKNRFYFKNAHAVDRLSHIDTVVFDKTGTITQTGEASVNFNGVVLTPEKRTIIRTIMAQSSHPLSRLIVQHLSADPVSRRALVSFEEVEGKGIQAQWGSTKVKIGSADWTGANFTGEGASSQVFVAFDDVIAGFYEIKSSYRPELESAVAALHQAGIRTFLLSGDKPVDVPFLSRIFRSKTVLHFGQTPAQKLDFIKALQSEGSNVMMVGDGLNDAGALRQSNVGIAVSEDANNFSPACDAILEGTELTRLPAYVRLARNGQRIIRASFCISLLYNAAGLSFALAGQLSPVIAAILMPVSSVTIVAFTTAASSLAARRLITDQGHKKAGRRS